MLRLLKLIAVLACFWLVSPVQAVENPVSSSTAITATVPGEPDTPVLISPKNNSVTNTTAPNFIFNPSLGSTAVSYYQLWLDGNLNTDHIPQSTLTIITNAKSALSQGQHTWMIKAMGSYSTTRNSATWIFTIDTTAPLILVNQVAEHTTSLSSLDLTTIPSNLTFTTTNRLPVISGQSEANAGLTISLISSASVTTLAATVGTDATFSLKPGSNLNYTSYTVLITSTDLAGNTTTLPSFTLKVQAPPKISLALPFLPTITLPQLQLPFSEPSAILPQLLLAQPLTATPVIISYLPWLIILCLLIHISCLIYFYYHYHYQTIYLYITLFLPIFLLLYLSLLTQHWLPIILTLLSLILLLVEHNSLRSQPIRPHQL